MKILITGGCGFIGAHFAKALASINEHEIILVDNFARGVQDNFLKELLAQDQVSCLEVDLLDENAVEKLPQDVDVVVHLAAIIGVRYVLERPYDVLTWNVRMLESMISYAKNLPNCQQFMFTSTSEIYAGTLKHFDLLIPTPESTPLAVTDLDEARTSYMLSKMYGEAMLRQSALPYTIVRPHNIYGERMGLSHVIPELLQKMHEAETDAEIPVFSVDHKRAFCHVADAVEQLCRLLGNEKAKGTVLNLGNGAAEVSIGYLAEEMQQLVNARLEKSMTLAAKEATPGSPTRRCPDTTAMEAITGYQPLVDLSEGIRRTYDWYVEHVFSGADVSAK